MDNKEYKSRKLDKMTRDMIKMVNDTPSFGYGEIADVLAKTAISNYMLTAVKIVELTDADFEILLQSMAEEMILLSTKLTTEINEYKELTGDSE